MGKKKRGGGGGYVTEKAYLWKEGLLFGIYCYCYKCSVEGKKVFVRLGFGGF